ncbi:hypothetical protein ACI79D_08725 [Geodermatophilus sp. SYSU D00708]
MTAHRLAGASPEKWPVASPVRPDRQWSGPMFQATAGTLQARRPRPEHSAPDWTGTLLLDKLSPPPLGFPPLPRPRLLQALTRGVATTPVTLLSGPAGSGKTVLAATWMRAQRGRRVAWLSLDAGDDDPTVFPPHLLAALRQAGLDLPDRPPPADSRRRPLRRPRSARRR